MNSPSPKRTGQLSIAAVAGAGGLAAGLVFARVHQTFHDFSALGVSELVALVALPVGLLLGVMLSLTPLNQQGERPVGALSLALLSATAAASGWVNGLFAHAALDGVGGVALGLLALTGTKLIGRSLPRDQVFIGNSVAVVASVLGLMLAFVLERLSQPAAVFLSVALAVGTLGWAARVPSRRARPTPASELVPLLTHPGLRRVMVVHAIISGTSLVLLAALSSALSLPAIVTWLFTFALGALAAPHFSDRAGLRRPFIVCGTLISTIAWALAAVAPGVGALAVAGFSMGSVSALALGTPLELAYVGAPRASSTLGLLAAAGHVGAVLVSAIVFVALRQFGPAPAFLVLSLINALAVVPASRLVETGRRAPLSPAPVAFWHEQA
jgi:hypothetical protein